MKLVFCTIKLGSATQSFSIKVFSTTKVFKELPKPTGEVTVSDHASDDEGEEGHEGGQDDQNADDDVPEIRFALLGPPAALTEERTQVEYNGQQADEYHKDRREGDVVTVGDGAAVHRPVGGVVAHRLPDAGVEDAAADAVGPVIRHDARTDAHHDRHGDGQRVEEHEQPVNRRTQIFHHRRFSLLPTAYVALQLRYVEGLLVGLAG